MSRLQQLPPDQRAALSLLLRSHSSHAEVAQMIGIDPAAVHDRAHAALAMLVPRLARRLDAQTCERIGEYLLGQLSEEQASAVSQELAASVPAREWALALAEALGDLAPGQRLPEIPGPRSAGGAKDAPPSLPAAAAQDAPRPLGRVSRRGGALLLAGLLAALAAVVVLVLSSGGSSPTGALAASRSSQARSASAKTGSGEARSGAGGRGGSGKTSAGGGNGSSQTGGTAAGSASKAGEGASGLTGAGEAEPKVEGHIVLSAPDPASPAKGVLLLASENGLRVMLLSAEHLQPTEGFTYVLWLISGRANVRPLAFEAPAVKATGKEARTMLAGRPLPEDASVYDRVELTKETVKHPTRPSSEVILSGELKAG